MISFDNVSFQYVDKKKVYPVFENVSFEIKDGEFFCIIGPSGCGKTTLLKNLAGFEKPQSGSIYHDGNPETCKKLLGVFYSAVYEFYKDPQGVAPIAAKYLTETSGSVYTEEDWLDMQLNYDFLTTLEDAKEGFFNPESEEYWRNSVDYQLKLLASDGVLTGNESADYYYGQSEQLFKDLFADQEL